MQESIVFFCSACTMSSLRKFTFAISSPDDFLVTLMHCLHFTDVYVRYACATYAKRNMLEYARIRQKIEYVQDTCVRAF